jgi:dimeric dUTPase (all-alpha-NTP-PPase superfamily)
MDTLRGTMEEIFNFQWKLNVYTLDNIGINYEMAITDPQGKPQWVENFRKALSAELAELIREVNEHGVGTRSGKIEIVDMLHFLVSLSHVVNISSSEVIMQSGDESSFTSCAVRAFLALDDLQNSVKWKWWAKGGGYKAEKARKSVLEIWKCFWELCNLFGMDFDVMKQIYMVKNKVNFQRQDQNYNEDIKTEEDDQALEVGI